MMNLNPSPRNSIDRPVLANICVTVPPYRRYALDRIVDEIPELQLLTINTHRDKWRDWQLSDEEKIGLHDISREQPAETTGLLSSIRGAWLDWKQGGETIALLRQEQAAAVIVNGYNDLGRLRTLRWCRRNQVPCFIWVDSNIASEKGLPFWKAMAKRCYIGRVLKWTSGSFACGRMGAEYWKHYGAKPEQVFISPYEPDYSLIESITADEIHAVSESFGLAEGRRRLLFSGRLVSAKRPDLLVKAFTAISEERRNWDLVMLGDGPMQESLRQIIPPEQQGRVHWIPFLNDQREVSAIYKACDVLVLPSSYEPWALVINEAVAAGLAVVASDVVAAAAELVVDGENGFIVPANAEDELRQALTKVTDNQKIDALKAASSHRLADWQRRGDPIAGIRQALSSVGVL